MVLEAGKNDEPLVCTLHNSDLRKMPYYEAILYVWGSDDRDHDISCNGQTVKITTNLQEVLRSVRLPTAARTLWADSICINQEDVTEKGQQVSLMGQLFKQTTRVLICVGSNNDGHAERFSSLLGELDDMVLKGIKKAGPSSDTFPRLDLESKSAFCLTKDGMRYGPLYDSLGLGETGFFRRPASPITQSLYGEKWRLAGPNSDGPGFGCPGD